MLRYLLLVSLALLAGCTSFSRPPPNLAIDNVTVVDPSTGKKQSARTVLIRDARIEAVVPYRSVASPAAMRIDGAGAYLVPGLVDSHIHLRHAKEDRLLAYLSAGITTAREMNGRDFILKWRNEINTGQRIGPTLLVASPAIGNFSSPKEGWPTPTTAAEGAGRVDEFFDQGYDFIKIYTFVPAAALDGIMSQAEKRGIRVVGHAPIEAPLEELVASGLWSLEHFTGIPQAIATAESARLAGDDNRDVFHAVEVDDSKLRRVAELAARYRVWQVPTMIYWEIVPGLPPFRKAWDNPELRQLGLRTRMRILKAMYDAGAPIAAGSDSDAGDDQPIESYWDELALMQRAGMPPPAVLKAATVDALAMLGIGDRGVVAAGLVADLILLKCDPTLDIACVRNPLAVISKGALVSAKQPS